MANLSFRRTKRYLEPVRLLPLAAARGERAAADLGALKTCPLRERDIVAPRSLNSSPEPVRRTRWLDLLHHDFEERSSKFGVNARPSRFRGSASRDCRVRLVTVSDWDRARQRRQDGARPTRNESRADSVALVTAPA